MRKKRLRHHRSERTYDPIRKPWPRRVFMRRQLTPVCVFGNNRVEPHLYVRRNRVNLLVLGEHECDLHLAPKRTIRPDELHRASHIVQRQFLRNCVPDCTHGKYENVDDRLHDFKSPNRRLIFSKSSQVIFCFFVHLLSTGYSQQYPSPVTRQRARADLHFLAG